MSKFTIFTIILAISVITVILDLAVREYMGKDAKVSVVEAEEGRKEERRNEERGTGERVKSVIESTIEESIEEVESKPISNDKENPLIPAANASRITQDLIAEAGFSGEIKEKHFKGKVFQLLDITKIPVSGISFYEIANSGIPVVSITEIASQDEIRALQLYILLQNKTKTYIDLSLNETNAYGDRSFYINHAKKPDEAFLTVKIGKNIYAFAYVKTYHPQVKKLIQILYG